MNRGSFLKKLGIGLAAIVGAPYLPALSASVGKLQTVNIVQAEYISGFIKVSNQMLSDIPGLISYLQIMLPKKLLEESIVQL